MELVRPETLVAQATQAGFVLLSSHRLALPSRKEFLVQVFELPMASFSFDGTSREKPQNDFHDAVEDADRTVEGGAS